MLWSTPYFLGRGFINQDLLDRNSVVYTTPEHIWISKRVWCFEYVFVFSIQQKWTFPSLFFQARRKTSIRTNWSLGRLPPHSHKAGILSTTTTVHPPLICSQRWDVLKFISSARANKAFFWLFSARIITFLGILVVYFRASIAHKSFSTTIWWYTSLFISEKF